MTPDIEATTKMLQEEQVIILLFMVCFEIYFSRDNNGQCDTKSILIFLEELHTSATLVRFLFVGCEKFQLRGSYFHFKSYLRQRFNLLPSMVEFSYLAYPHILELVYPFPH